MYYNIEGSQSHSALIIEANMKLQEKNLLMIAMLFSMKIPDNTTDTDEGTNSTKGR